MMPGITLYVFTAALIGFASCASFEARDSHSANPEEGEPCTLEARASFILKIVDATSGTRVRGAMIQVIRVDNEGITKTIKAAADDYFPDQVPYKGLPLMESAGHHTVTVTAPGYENSSKELYVEMEEDGCHVESIGQIVFNMKRVSNRD